MRQPRDLRPEKDVFTKLISSSLTARMREDLMKRVYVNIEQKIKHLCVESPGFHADKRQRLRKIRAILKGGHALKLLSSHFVRHVEQTRDLQSHLKQYLQTTKQEFWEVPISDLDFSIYIDPSLPDFKTVHQKVCDIVYESLVEYKQWLDKTNFITEAVKKNLDTHQFISDIRSNCGENTPAVPIKLHQKDSLSINPNELNPESIFRPLDEPRLKQTSVYLTYNNCIRWPSRSWLTGSYELMQAFALLRIKLNLQLNRNEKEENLPGELIDVSIPFQDDRNLRNFFGVGPEAEVFKKFTGVKPGLIDLRKIGEPSLIVTTQDFHGLIEDTLSMLFSIDDGGRFPWERAKSQKRTKRLAFLCFLHYLLEWMKASTSRSYLQQWSTLKVFMRLFDCRTYRDMSVCQDAKFRSFTVGFQQECNKFRNILFTVAKFEDRTRPSADAAFTTRANLFLTQHLLDVTEF